MLCVGETAMERGIGETNDVIHDQLVAGLANLTAEDMRSVVIAYEPVWAISGGKDFMQHATPTPDDCRSVQQMIRRQVTHMFGKKIADDLPVLYGGSVNADNATGFAGVQGIDGFLVGGASLKIEQFVAIIEACFEASKKDSAK